MTESGVRATCFGAFTIVYRHRSTEWPLPYTDSRIHGAHEIKKRKERRAKEGRKTQKKKKQKVERKKKKKKERPTKGKKENTQ